MGKVRKVVRLVCLRKGPFASKTTRLPQNRPLLTKKKKNRQPLDIARSISNLRHRRENSSIFTLFKSIQLEMSNELSSRILRFGCFLTSYCFF